MSLLSYIVHGFVYEFLLLLCAAPLLALFEFEDRLSPVIAVPVAIFFVLYFFGSIWVSHTAAFRRVYGDEGFFEALTGAVDDVRLKTTLLLMTLSKPFRATRSSRDVEPEDSDEHFRGT